MNYKTVLILEGGAIIGYLMIEVMILFILKAQGMNKMILCQKAEHSYLNSQMLLKYCR